MSTLQSCQFFTALCGIALFGGLLSAGPLAHAAWTEHSASGVHQQVFPSTDTTTADSSGDAASSLSTSEPDEESGLERVIEILILGPIVTILLGLLLAVPTVLLAVSLVMDGGCLRYILFGVGWLCAIIYGLLTGAVVGEAILGLEFLVKPIAYVFIWGYPIAAYWGYKTLQAMPQEQYQAWDQTLTGGAVLGFGAGSVVGLFRSAASGFGGFGGGSFGGGGASGSWSGASGAAGSTAVTGAGGGSATATRAASASAGGVSTVAAVATGAAPGGTRTNVPGSSGSGSAPLGFWARWSRWFRKFEWYHGLVFVLVTLVFVPLGLGTMKALQNTTFFVVIVVCGVAYTGYKLLYRTSSGSESGPSPIATFRGGEASSSWS